MNIVIITLIFLPLIGFLINGLFGRFLPKVLVGGFATLLVFVSFILASCIFLGYSSESPAQIIHLFKWFEIGRISIDFSFQIDQLSILMILVITGVGSLIHLYSMGYMSNDEGYHRFFAYLNLFVFSMLILVLGSNYLILFIGWEGVGVCSYLLIGFWYKNIEYGKAARKAFIMNRIGDLGVLIGIFAIAYYFSTVNYLEVSERVSNFSVDNAAIVFITGALFIGAMGKSAQIPLFTWLPDAMAGPTPVSALIHAATMVTAGIYLVVRSNFLYTLAPSTMDFIMYIGLITSLIASFIALRQNDIKKVLAYSTVSQLGFMFIALGVGSYTTAMFHLITHAFFKALLFLGSGSVIHAMGGEQDMRNMGGLKNKIPLTYWTFLIGTLAITGFPFLSGMISKDEILTVAFSKSRMVWFFTFISAVMTAIYMFRLLYLTFFGEFRGSKEQKEHLHESPVNMTFPLVVLAVLSVVGGVLNLPHFLTHDNSHKLTNWLSSVIVSPIELPEVSLVVELILLSVTVLMFVVVWLVVRKIYVKNKKMALPDQKYEGWERLSAQKLRVDEVYNVMIVKPIEGIGLATSLFDKYVLDRIVNFVSIFAKFFGKYFERLQTGNVETYLLIMSFAIGTILIVNFLFNF